jgi:hypothetical protein
MTVSRQRGTFYFDFMVSFFPILKSEKIFLYVLFSSQKNLLHRQKAFVIIYF